MNLRNALPAFALAGSLLATSASAQIGTIFCAGQPNSTGSASVMSASGSTNVSQNDVTLSVDGLPANQFGLFITSQTPILAPNPGGSNGDLCIGGSLGRITTLVNSGSTGDVSLALDLTGIPNSNALYAVAPGDTVYFQLWHRDTAAPGFSNFSPGIQIAFDAAPPSISFATDIYPMLTQANINAPACNLCHGAQFGTCGFGVANDAATAYAEIVSAPSGFCCANQIYVIPGDPGNSLLYQKLTNPACGGRMPQGGTFAGDTNVVRDWILAGAPF
ncbi:MAG: hypothetical protein VX015_03095 [Planctomycetota bacterium]|nr:hypothetical protein [Planctomycetota bacterium]MEC8511106.1 hypothetical protein [Planctomycetota bacterium]